MEDGYDFLAAAAETSATLTGLLFVALSINLQQILQTSGLADLAAESMGQLVGSVLLGLAALVPGVPLRILGCVILVIDLLLWLTQTKLQAHYIKQNLVHPRHWVVKRIMRTAMACLSFAVAGICLMLGNKSGLYWLLPGFLFSLIAAVANAWLLLVEILR